VHTCAYELYDVETSCAADLGTVTVDGCRSTVVLNR